MSWSPEFYAMCTAYWTAYSPVLFIWMAVIIAFSGLVSVALFVYFATRPLFNKLR